MKIEKENRILVFFFGYKHERKIMFSAMRTLLSIFAFLFFATYMFLAFSNLSWPDINWVGVRGYIFISLLISFFIAKLAASN
jgi:hypothetical protein